MSSYLSGLFLTICFMLTGEGYYLIAGVVMVAAGDIRRQLKEQS